jgi:hypothetical protein
MASGSIEQVKVCHGQSQIYRLSPRGEKKKALRIYWLIRPEIEVFQPPHKTLKNTIYLFLKRLPGPGWGSNPGSNPGSFDFVHFLIPPLCR